MFRSMLMATTAVSLSLMASQALAEAAKPAADATVAEVVVTATRREERVLDVPYNISAVSGQAIDQAKVQSTAELLRTVPGVSVVDRGYRNQGVSNSIQIRGLNVDSAILGDYAVSAVAPVSSYVNDTPLFANFALKDVDRVEVLRGPQGTLYGSGSLGGTIRYILHAPELGQFGGKVSATTSQVTGSGGLGWAGDGTINIPLGDKVALRITGSIQDYPGLTDYVNIYKLDSTGAPVAPNGVLSSAAVYETKKDADTVNIKYGRAALRVQPAEWLDMTLSYARQSDDIGGRRQVTRGVDGYGHVYGKYDNGSVQLEPSSREVSLTALETTVDLGFATLTSSTSSYDHHGDSVSENTGYYAKNGWLSFYYNFPRPMASAVRSYSDRAFIEEIRLVSQTKGPLDYVVGGFYEKQKLGATQASYLRGFKRWWDAAYPAFKAEVQSDQDFAYDRHEDFTDKALFGELTYHVNDRLQVTGGVRWFDNQSKSHTFMDVPVYTSLSAPTNASFQKSDSKALYKANVSWKFGERGLAYATVSEGYRRGGANAVPTIGRYAEDARWQQYGPDRVVNYEAGLKGISHGITYNAALFYVDWKDIQINTVTPNWGFFVAQNGGTARSQGLEAQIDGRLEGVHYSLGYTYTDAKLTENAYPPTGSLTPVARKGARLPGTAEHAVTFALDHAMTLSNGVVLTGRLNGYYQSATRNAVTTSTRLNVGLAPFQIWNTSATATFDKWSATLFVKNIFNADGVTGRFTEGYMGTDPADGYYGNGAKDLITLPRTVGLTLDYPF
ncbi:TonB-dependent receptor [Phenylobacterium aquaticum]|uniref:TonB-dependent receptor n=2 Tax=Phenylobacterium aquaticum TaxID=1763816 RepID=UPI0026F0E1C9|nr:TonB-dependent receptor [Phenylobacterium aquaticum]